MKLAGKTTLITGGSRGIGRAVAEAFAREGARVFVTGHNDQAALDATITQLRSLGTDADGGLYDVSRYERVEAMCDAIAARFGGLDAVVNNAGALTPTPLLDITPERWEATIRTNLTGNFFVLRETARRFLIPQKRGKIVNVSAQSAIRGSIGVADYAAAKGGIIALTRNAAREFKPYNVQVNAVLPVARSRMTDALADLRPADAERLRALAPPDAVAPMFVFLASDDADYVSGQIIGADGGATA